MSQAPDTTPSFDQAAARARDASDPLSAMRVRFHIPVRPNGEPFVYMCGNSLGCMPRAAQSIVEQELADWSRLAVEGHFDAAHPWYSYHEDFRAPLARLVGASTDEVVVMNSLTVNLHLMLVTFFQPQGKRCKILMDWPAFPSDIYALKTHLRTRGLDPDEHLLICKPRAGEHCLRHDDFESMLQEHGDEIALVLFAGVNFFTGQAYDMERLAAAAHERGCVIGLDLAHAAGNVPLSLHDWDIDFACWCHYKYLNSGPGAIAGCFVHERHVMNTSLPRYGGWWGNDPDSRFLMHTNPDFEPRAHVDGWQLSNPPILAMAPLRASLALFDEVGMTELRARSIELTGCLRGLIERHPSSKFEIITPRDVAQQGCQLSILVHDEPKARFTSLENAGVLGDFREPNVIRLAPTPLYNSFEDVWRCADALCCME